MKEQELERTFLPKSLPEEVLKSRSKEIVDVYYPLGTVHSALRIRKSGDSYEMTKKEVIGEGVGKQRVEHTIKLTREEYEALLHAPGMRVSKMRYYYDADGHTYEVGVYAEALKGLVIIDVEFPTLEAMEKFVMPEWFLTEVSHHKELRAGMLCGKSYVDIEEKLTELGYQKIT